MLLEKGQSGALSECAGCSEYGNPGFSGVFALDAALDCLNRVGSKFIERNNLKLTHMLGERWHEKKQILYA